jgi:predicted HNH restriction endonuclease
LYKEWYGLGEFNDSFGGVDGRNKMYGSKWRSHIDRQHYSRTMRVVLAIDVTAPVNGCSWREAVNELEPVFQEVNKSLANMVKKLQEKGIISKGKTRGVKRKATEEASKETS